MAEKKGKAAKAKAPVEAKKTKPAKAKAARPEPQIRRGAAFGRIAKDTETTQVLTRWPVGEYDAVRDAAKGAGLNIGTFIRESAKAGIEGKPFKASSFKKELVKAVTASAEA